MWFFDCVFWGRVCVGLFVCVVVCFGEEGLVVFVVVVWLCVLGKGGWDSLWFGGRERRWW